MRFRQLDLLAFGPFDQTRLSFEPSRPALHVIFGNNEAGKSTALRAISGFLYGIPLRSSDDHTHARQQLRIGAEVCNAAGETLYVVRRKGKKATLLDADGSPVDEARLASYLGGVTDGMFHNMFGLNHETLRAGAQALLEGQGDVGESLFGAALGSPALHGVLDHFRQQADALFTPRGRAGKSLNAALEELKRERDKQRLAATSPNAYLAQQAELERLQAQRDSLNRERQRVSAEQNKLKRVLSVLPRLVKLEQIEQNLAALGEVPNLPADCEQVRRQASKQIERAEYTEQQLGAQAERLTQRLAALQIRQSLTQLSTQQIQDLNHRLGRARAALVDQPKREAQHRKVTEDAQTLLQRVRPGWEFERVEELRLSTAFKARVKVLAQQHAELSVNRRVLKEAKGRVEQDVQQVEQALAELPGVAVDIGLRTALRQAQRDRDLEQRLESSQRQLRELDQLSQIRLKELGRYSGSLEALLSISWPTAQAVRSFEREFAESRRKRQELTLANQELQDAEERLRRDLDELRLQGDVPTEHQLRELRNQRDGLWQSAREAVEAGASTGSGVDLVHVRGLLVELREAQQRCDTLADQLRLQAGRVNRLATLQAQEQALERRRAVLGQRQRDWQQHEAELHESWRKAWVDLGAAPGDPEEMLEWLDSVAQLRGSSQQRSRLALEVGAMSTRLQQLVAVLKGSSEPGERPPRVGAEDETLEALIDVTDRALTRTEAQVAERKELERRRRQLQAEVLVNEEKFAAHREEWRAWLRDWSEALGRLGLGADALPDEVLATVEELDQLFHLVDEAQSLKERVDGMRRDTQALAVEVKELMRQHIPEGAEAFVVDAAARLIEEHQQTEQQLRERAELQAELSALTNSRDEAQLTRDNARQNLRRLMERANVTSLEALEAAERQRAELERLMQRASEVTDELVALGDGASLQQLRQESLGANADEVRARLIELGERLDTLSERLQATAEDTARCEIGLQRLDAGAAEDAQSVEASLAKIRTYAERYVRNRLAAVFLEREIEKYRAQNQGPILERAGALFPRLSVGRYQSLQVDFDDRDRQVLVCCRHDGQKVGIEALSDGTRDQLYLSLRLASLERFSQYNEAFPVVLDDILIHFDDERARAALEVLAEFSQSCQVLFFTHHQRLVQLARDALPAESVRFLELPAAQVAGSQEDGASPVPSDLRL